MRKLATLTYFTVLAFTGTAQVSFDYNGSPGGPHYYYQANFNDNVPGKSRFLSHPSFNFKPSIDYLGKSKKQKKAALILLGSGAGLIVTSFIIPRGDLVKEGIIIGPYSSNKYKNEGIKSAFLITGGASSLASIPFFIASKKNQKKALQGTASFRMETSPIIRYSDFANRYYPGISVTMCL